MKAFEQDNVGFLRMHYKLLFFMVAILPSRATDMSFRNVQRAGTQKHTKIFVYDIIH